MAEPWLPREEYIALHNEVLGARAQLARVELACVLGVAALFAWLVRGAGDYAGYEGLVWLLPILIPAYGCLKAWAIHCRLGRLRGYLSRLEGDASPGAQRRQGYLEQERSRARGAATWVAWLLLLLATLAVSTLGFADYREQCPGPLRNACMQDEDLDQQTQGT